MPARARRRATFASSPGRSSSSRFRMSFSSYFSPAVVRARSVVCTSPVTTRRNDDSCLDSLAIARMLTAAPARASVTRASSPVLSATKTLNSFMDLPPRRGGGTSGELEKSSPPAAAGSGDEPSAVPGEEDRLTDVREVEQLLDEPVEAEAPSAVGRHPVPEGLQVEIEALRVQSLLLHARDERVVAVLSLSARSHLVPLVFEVEGLRVLRLVLLRHHVERLDGARVLDDEEEIVALVGESLPQELFSLGVDVVAVADALPVPSEDLERFRVRQPPQRELWPLRTRVEHLELGLGLLPHRFDRVIHRALQKSQDVLLALDPRELPVERRELRHMPDRVGGLRAEGRPDLVDAVEACRHEDLLIQLRALAQVRRPSEVVRAKERGASLGTGAGELRGLDFDEALRIQEATQGARDNRAHAKDRTSFRLPQIQHAVVEARIDLRAHLVGDRERKRGQSGAQSVEGRCHEFPSVPDFGVWLDHSADEDHTLPHDPRGAVEEGLIRRLLDGHLERPVPLPDDEERDPAEVPHVLDPTAEESLLPLVPLPDRSERTERGRHGGAENEEVY